METIRPLTQNSPFLFASGLFGLLIVLAASAGSAVPRPVPESLLRVVRLSEPRLHPDGSLVAFTACDGLDPTLTQIWLAGTDGDGPLRPFTAGGRSARSPRWSPDGAALLFLSARADTAKDQVQWIALDGGSSSQITNEPLGIQDMEWSPDGRNIACIVPVAPPQGSDPLVVQPLRARFRLAVLDVRGEPLRMISPDTVDVWGFAWSPDGAALAVLTSPPGVFGEWRRGGMALVGADGTGWKPLPVPADPTMPAAYSPDGDRIAFYLRAADDLSYPVLAVMDRDGSSFRRLTPPDFAETDEGIGWAGDGSLRTASFAGVRSYINRVDAETGARTRIVERWAAPRHAGRTFSCTANGGLAYLGEGPDTPGDLYFLAPGRTEPLRITLMNPALQSFGLPEPRVVTWKSFDGRRIEGLLYLPRGEKAHRALPLIVHPHGGPGTLWALGFHGFAEYPGVFLATRGYAVLYPNPRGSAGYGETFFGLNRGDPGGGDLLDIEAGIDSLAAAGVVDGSRVAIAGFSYGGYLAARAITTSDRYRCAIVGAAPVNFFSDFTRNELSPYWHSEYLGGTPYETPSMYVDRSPVFHTRDIRTPVLIIHGAEDRRVSPDQAREFLTALKAAGKETELVLYPGEGHGISTPPHQVDFMNRQLAWFDAHLRPAGGKDRP